MGFDLLYPALKRLNHRPWLGKVKCNHNQTLAELLRIANGGGELGPNRRCRVNGEKREAADILVILASHVYVLIAEPVQPDWVGLVAGQLGNQRPSTGQTVSQYNDTPIGNGELIALIRR